MLADGQAKSDRPCYMMLRSFLRKPKWELIFDERFLSAKRRAILGKNIFEETTESEVRELIDRKRQDQENRLASRTPARPSGTTRPRVLYMPSSDEERSEKQCCRSRSEHQSP